MSVNVLVSSQQTIVRLFTQFVFNEIKLFELNNAKTWDLNLVGWIKWERAVDSANDLLLKLLHVKSLLNWKERRNFSICNNFYRTINWTCFANGKVFLFSFASALLFRFQVAIQMKGKLSETRLLFPKQSTFRLELDRWLHTLAFNYKTMKVIAWKDKTSLERILSWFDSNELINFTPLPSSSRKLIDAMILVFLSAAFWREKAGLPLKQTSESEQW